MASLQRSLRVRLVRRGLPRDDDFVCQAAIEQRLNLQTELVRRLLDFKDRTPGKNDIAPERKISEMLKRPMPT